MRRLHAALVVILALAAAACGGGSETPAPAASAAVLEPVREPDSCRPCHAKEVELFEASAHRVAARRFDDAARPAAARIAADAPVDDLARPEMSFRPKDGGGVDLLVPDEAGATETRTITHALGGVRREDFLSPVAGAPHVLPVSWSVTRSSWINPVAEEIGGSVERAAPLGWTSPRRAHAGACSRCHPLPSGDAAAGIACATCHGDATAHVAMASKKSDPTTWARNAMRRAGSADPWKGCGPCHATGKARPRQADFGPDAPLLDRMLVATLAGPGGFDVSFRLDGAPRVAHGMEVQALATSPCFMKGGATCTTCHDPHGGPGGALKDADPDASCRSCHAEIAKDAAAHAKHRVATTPVPSSRDERGGMTATRLPGCVDCHAPSLVPFGKGDLARDHAISVPSPRLEKRLGIAGACAACHPNDSADKLETSMGARKETARDRRMKALLLATNASSDKDLRAAIAGLTALVGDAGQDPWTRASASFLLAGAGGDASGAAPALQAAWEQTSDPVLAMAATNAQAKVGGPLEPLKARLDQEKDWRVALSIAGGLSARGDQRGAEALDAMYSDAKLPDIARSDAGSELAVALIQSQACRRAASVLADCLTKDPDSVPAWLNLGVARACVGDAAGAREAFVRVLELQPGHQLALKNMQSLDAAAAGAGGAP